MHIDLPVLEAGMVVGNINLDTGKIKIEGSTSIKFTCSLNGDCCSILKIPVTDFDIKRIEDQGYEIYQIVESLSPQLRLPKTKYGNIEKNFWMKRNPFTGSCTFLENNRCSIYQFKPFACSIFPFSLKYIDRKMVEVLIHPSNLCQTLTLSKQQSDGNKFQLKKLMSTILAEETYRDEYFEKYGDKV